MSQVPDISKSLSKKIAMQRQQHLMKVIHNLPNTPDPITFLENTEVVNEVHELDYYMKIVCFPELDNREYISDGMVVISCLHYKTGSQG